MRERVFVFARPRSANRASFAPPEARRDGWQMSDQKISYASVAISSAAASCSETHNAILHVPAGDGPFPLLVYLHGGFWKPEWTREATGSAAFLATFTSPPAEVAAASPLGPVATLSVEYARVAQDDPANSEGGGGFPGTQLDVLAAVNEVASLHRAGGEDGTAGAAAARLDLGSVFLAGHSAGGQMARCQRTEQFAGPEEPQPDGAAAGVGAVARPPLRPPRAGAPRGHRRGGRPQRRRAVPRCGHAAMGHNEAFGSRVCWCCL